MIRVTKQGVFTGFSLAIVCTNDKYRMLSSKESLFYKASKIYRLLLLLVSNKRVQAIKALINNKIFPSITSLFMTSIAAFYKSYFMA